MTAPDADGPVAFTVTSGQPTDLELAALAVVLASLRRDRGRPHPPEQALVAGGWKSYWAAVQHRLVPGRDAWRSMIRR